jgi:predicted PurR-regulated permease PerM
MQSSIESMTANPDMRRWTSWLAFIGIFLISLWLVYRTLLPLWKPLLLAAVLAGITHRWHRALARGVGNRPRIAAVIMTVALIVLVLVPVIALSAVLWQQAVGAVGYIRAALAEGGLDELAQRLPDGIEEPLRRLAKRVPVSDDVLREQAAAGGLSLAELARQVVATISKVIFGLIMMLIAYFALLLDGPRLLAWIEKVSPLPNNYTGELFTELRKVSRSVVGSTFISAAAQAGVAAIGYIVAGAPSVVLLSALTGLAAMIPLLGTPIVSLPVAAGLLLTGNLWQGIFLAAYSIIIISSVDNIVKPLVVRGGMQLSSAVVFFALIGGLLAFGSMGLIVGPLAVSFFLAMLRFVRRDETRDRVGG